MTERVPLPALLAVLAIALGACNAGTGTASGRTGSGAASEDEASAAGERPALLAAFDGAYARPGLARYVTELGQRVARSAGGTDVAYRFTVLNSAAIDAFALRGGDVYVTRGLLALVGSEAELAGMLGHEIGHIATRHAAPAMLPPPEASLALQAAALLGAAVPQGTSIALGRYSGPQELEADALGVGYLAQSGYDPQAMASLRDSLAEVAPLEANRAGGTDLPSMMQMHPQTADGLRRAIAGAGVPSANPLWNRTRFLQQIDGMIWGQDPREGVVERGSFIHPALRFAFDAPPGMRLQNTPHQVLGQGGHAVMVFDLADPAPDGSLAHYLAAGWQQQIRVTDVQSFAVNGMETASGLAQVSVGGVPVTARLVVLRQHANAVYRFMFVAPADEFEAGDVRFMASARSFRDVSAEAASHYRVKRIHVVAVQTGETVQSLSARMQTGGAEAAWFRVINHLAPGAALSAGQRVKIVVEDPGATAALPPDPQHLLTAGR